MAMLGVGTSDSQEPLSAADRVPIEIWQQIFLLLLSSESVSGLDEIFGPIWGRASPPESSRGTSILPQSPSLISQVCYRWKKYAFGMPYLWNAYAVKAPRLKSDISSRNLAELINIRLSLSQSMPLKNCINSKDDEGAARTFIRATIPFSSRWEIIHLEVPPKALSELFPLHPKDLPRLTSLKTHAKIYAPETVAITPKSSPELDQIRLFKSIPAVRRFCTSYLPPPICHVYAGLEELHIQENRSETWSTLQVLATCLNLRVLTLSGFGITRLNGGPSASYPGLVLPELHTLNLEHPTGRERLLQILVLPSLKALLIAGCCSGESTRSILNSIHLLMRRSEVQSLERLFLSLETHTMDTPLLINFLACNPLLKELRIDDTAWQFLTCPLVTSFLLNALTCQNTIDYDNHIHEAPLCAQLEIVSFAGCSDFEDEKLLAFLNSRCWPGQTGVGVKDFSGVAASSQLVSIRWIFWSKGR